MTTHCDNKPFDRKQLLVCVEAILTAVLGRVESGQPTSISWQERCEDTSPANPTWLTGWDRTAVETAGAALAALYARLTGDGLGIYDALHCASHFDKAVEAWVSTAWGDEGEAVFARMEQLGPGGWPVKDAYENYPDCRKHAEAFVDEVFGDYLTT